MTVGLSVAIGSIDLSDMTNMDKVMKSFGNVTSGLGIALVRTLVELHGGRVETEIGIGYRRVVCTLPLDPTGRAMRAASNALLRASSR